MRITKRPRFYLLALIMIAHEAPAATINLAGSPENSDELGKAVSAGDFNCDGFDDLAVGVPYEDGNLTNTGVINIVYGGTGSGGRLGTTGNFYLNVGATVEENDQMGWALASGDFNGDGCGDLAAGIHNKAVAGQSFAGQVMVFYGDENGPGASRQTWHQNVSGVFGGAEKGDQFGWSLAAGDFNGDGRDDLAIGVIGENSYGGGVHVLHGHASGLTAASSLYFDQNSPGVADDRESFDHFGRTLTSGDFNGDGYADLVVGVPEESWYDQFNQIFEHGVVHVLYGSSSSLSAEGSQLWRQGYLIPGIVGEFDHFGMGLAAGDFNGDSRDDLAIGVPEVVGDEDSSGGRVYVLYGMTTGLSATGNQVWHTDDPGIGLDEDSDMGGTLAAGDFNGDGRDDLAIGAQYNNSGGAQESGAVKVLYGQLNGGLSGSPGVIHQNIANVEGGAEAFDRFGASLAAGDFNNDGKDDVAVGIPYEDHSSSTNAGAAQVFYGTAGTLDLANDQLFVQ